MSSKKPLDILIVGTGAVGSLLGWRLAQHAHTRLTVVCRSNYDAIKRDHITLKTKMWGDGRFRPDEVLRPTDNLGSREYDYVVCATKSSSSTRDSFIRNLRPAISARTTLVSAQNGINVEAPLRNAFPQHTILSAICYVSCMQNSPGVVHQVSNLRPHAFHIGIHGTDETSIHAQRVLRDFVDLDSSFKTIHQVPVERWTKQIFNGAWNPVCALSGLDTHSTLASPYAPMVHQLATEMHDVARKQGVPLPDDLPSKTIDVARNSAALVPSMLQDVKMGRPTEVESLCGNISRLAHRTGVATPTLDRVYALLSDRERTTGERKSKIPPQLLQGVEPLPIETANHLSQL